LSDSGEEILAEGKFVRLVRRGRWEYAERTNAPAAVVIVAVNEANELVLVEQYRAPVGKQVIELPAGLVGDIAGAEDEDMAVAALRELLEETGYAADGMEFLTEGPPSPGMSTEHAAFLRATGVCKVGDGGGDEHEQIKVHEVPLQKVDAWLREMVRAGYLIDPKIYIGLYFAERNAITGSAKEP